MLRAKLRCGGKNSGTSGGVKVVSVLVVLGRVMSKRSRIKVKKEREEEECWNFFSQLRDDGREEVVLNEDKKEQDKPRRQQKKGESVSVAGDYQVRFIKGAFCTNRL